MITTLLRDAIINPDREILPDTTEFNYKLVKGVYGLDVNQEWDLLDVEEVDLYPTYSEAHRAACDLSWLDGGNGAGYHVIEIRPEIEEPF